MTVQCPSCKTRFPVDPRKIPVGGVHARCSVCSEVFFVAEQAPFVETAPPLFQEDEPTAVGMDLPEAEVLEEETVATEGLPAAEIVIEAPDADEEEAEPVFEAPEAVEEEAEPAFEVPEALEEDGEPVFEASEAVEEEAEPAFEVPEPVEGEAEPFFEAPEAVEEEAEPFFEAPEAVEEEAEPFFEAPEAGGDEAEPDFEAWDVVVEEAVPVVEIPEAPKLPFELPAIAVEVPGPLVDEPEHTFELPEIVTDERTFGDGAPTFGDGEATFSMDSPAFDIPVEMNDENAPTFGDPSPNIDFSGFSTEQVVSHEETEEGLDEGETPHALPEEMELTPDAATTDVSGFAAPLEESVAPEAEEPVGTLESPETVIEEPFVRTPVPSPPPAPEPGTPLPTPHFGRRDPKEKAQRLARVLVSDIILYNPDRHQRAVEQGILKEEFEDEIQKSWNEYIDQVGEEIANSTNFFNEALNEILAKGQPLF